MKPQYSKDDPVTGTKALLNTLKMLLHPDLRRLWHRRRRPPRGSFARLVPDSCGALRSLPESEEARAEAAPIHYCMAQQGAYSRSPSHSRSPSVGSKSESWYDGLHEESRLNTQSAPADTSGVDPGTRSIRQDQRR
jgi:hypothetical protein